MSRTPTSIDVQFAWHRGVIEALQVGGRIVAVINQPQCGWFQRKLVHGGPFVPARIFLEQEVDPDTGELIADEVMKCEVNGRERDVVAEWSWLWNNCISEAEFLYMTAQAKWAERWRPSDPAAQPRERLDHLTTPIRF